jgi:RNA polymerase sigma factor (sigma-70 family)
MVSLRCYKGMVAATTLIDSVQRVFESLFAQEYGRVSSIAFRITRDAAEAEDVAQEVFARFAQTRRSPQNAQAWLYQAAVHTALNAVRARRRRADRELRVVRLQRPLENEAADPHAIVERQADSAMVRAALLRIRPADAELLALRYAGLSYREIADVVRVDGAQIGTRLARAERAFKREIERETSG